jgi:DNA (cytosine-5)-methyltransferase 1
MTDQQDTSRIIRAVDLFCGIGGNSEAARQIGIEVIAGFDKWDLVTKVYQDNFPGAKVFNKCLENTRIPFVKRKIGEIDLILASPECTSHSIARGNRAPDESSLQLAFQVTRFTEYFRPRWILIENVIQMKDWDEYGWFRKNLIKQGYKITEQELIASDFGVPQSRKRLFLLCDKEMTPPEIAPYPETHQKVAREIVDLNGTYKYSPLYKKGRAEKTIERAQGGMAVHQDDPFLLVYYGSGGNGNGGFQSLDIPLRTVTTLDRFALLKQSKEGPVMRMLQVPELQAAMGFPLDFKLNHGTRRDKIHMLGNAVCPPLVKTILEQMLGFSKKENLGENGN